MRRIDSEGREVTNLPGLWSESDTVLASSPISEQWLSQQPWLINGRGCWWFRSNTSARIVLNREWTKDGQSLDFFRLEVFCMTLLSEPTSDQVLAFKAFLES